MFLIYSPHSGLPSSNYMSHTTSPLRTLRNVRLASENTEFGLSRCTNSTVNNENFCKHTQPKPQKQDYSAFSPPSQPEMHSRLEQRVHSANSAEILSKHTTDARSQRKTLFLERLKTRRDDTRANRTEEQLLRMDYIRERRLWEERMKKQAPTQDDQMMHDTEIESVEWSPPEDTDFEELRPTEDKELGELVTFLDGTGMREDDDYDDLFLQVAEPGFTNSNMEIT